MATKVSGLPTPPPSPRANSSEVARDKVTGWLPEAAKKVDPAGTPYTPFGPGTKAWAAKGGSRPMGYSNWPPASHPVRSAYQRDHSFDG
jgi:hypothetical protein